MKCMKRKESKKGWKETSVVVVVVGLVMIHEVVVQEGVDGGMSGQYCIGVVTEK